MLDIIAIMMLWRLYRKNKIDAHVVSVGTAFLVAHLVSLITVFENPTSYLYFFFFLAFINSQFYTDQGELTRIKDLKSENVSVGLIAIVSLVILLLIYSTNINPARANKSTLNINKNHRFFQNINYLLNH